MTPTLCKSLLLAAASVSSLLLFAEPAAAEPKAAAAEARKTSSLELVVPKPVFAAEVVANGRAVPLYSAKLGCRLAAKITGWGQDAAGRPLDVGMAVKKGDVLFSVEPDTFKAKLATATASLAAAEAALANVDAQKAVAEAAAISALAAKGGAESEVASAEAKLKDKQADEQRYQRLVEVDKTVPLKRLEEVRLELETLRQMVIGTQARVKAAAAQIQGAQAQVRAVQAQRLAAEAQMNSAASALESARLDVRDTEVRAPYDGIITARFRGLGDYIGGAPFVEVLELTTADLLEAELKLPEAYLGQIIPGKTQVALSAPGLRNELTLPVSRVVPDIDLANGTFIIRIAIPAEKRQGLVPGNFLSGHFRVESGKTAVVVPLRAVVRDSRGPAVMVAGDKKMVRRPVELGSALTEGIVVLSGLSVEDKVVVGAAEELKDGAPLP